MEGFALLGCILCIVFMPSSATPKNKSPQGAGLSVHHRGWMRACVTHKAEGGRDGWQVRRILSEPQEWRLTSEHPFEGRAPWPGVPTTTPYGSSVPWGGMHIEHHPKIGNHPSLLFSWMIHPPRISTARFVILSSPTTKNLCHIPEGLGAPCPL